MLHQNGISSAKTFISMLASSSAVKNINSGLNHQSAFNADMQSIDTIQRTGNEPLNGASKSLSGAKIERSFIQPAHNFPSFEKLYANENNSKPTICDKNDRQLNKYELLVNPLIEKCNEKDEQLAENKVLIDQLQVSCGEKDEQLAENKVLIDQLQTSSNEKNEHLAENKALIGQLKEKCIGKDEQLAENKTLIDQLQVSCGEKDKQLAEKDEQLAEKNIQLAEKDEQLAENEKTIKQLQTECSSKEEQLNEKAICVKRLEEDCEEKDRQLIERGNTIRDLQEKSINRNESLSIFNSGNILKAIFLCFVVALIVALAIFADRKFGQRQSTEESNSFLKQSTVNELNALSNSLQLFDQEEIDATNSTLIFDQKYILLYRAKAYFELGDYSDAYQYLGVALRLDPDYEEAQHLLTVIQEHIDRVN